MFHDLDVPVDSEDMHMLKDRLNVLEQQGYRVVAVSTSVVASAGTELPPCPPIDRIRALCTQSSSSSSSTPPPPLSSSSSAAAAAPSSSSPEPSGITLLARLNVVIPDRDSTEVNHAQALVSRASNPSSGYHVVAALPMTERALRHCCAALDVDIITMDLGHRSCPKIRPQDVILALRRGLRFELPYHSVFQGSLARRNFFLNGRLLAHAARKHGLILSSGAHRSMDIRAPLDVINLATLLGLPPGTAKAGLTKECQQCLDVCVRKRTKTYREAIRLID